MKRKISLFSLVFFPGTALYDRAWKDGTIRDEKKEVYERSLSTSSYFRYTVRALRWLTKKKILKSEGRAAGIFIDLILADRTTKNLKSGLFSLLIRTFSKTRSLLRMRGTVRPFRWGA
ncbi:MAG TPA: hypothetical protein VMZ05_00260 [Spirochaetota bacterium]|nr:hypothetical protein [Spirochaetota bacterium]